MRTSRLPGQRGRTGRKPVHPADPAIAVLRVPADRLQDPVLPPYARLPARLAGELLVAHAEREDIARARAIARHDRGEPPAGWPEAVVLADLEDELRPVAHRDVLPLAVDVDVAGDTAGCNGE